MQNLRGKLLFSILLGLVVFAGLFLYADVSDVAESLSDFNWALLPLILALTTVNYLFRFLKWQYYLRLIQVRGLSTRDSFLIFFSGMGMVKKIRRLRCVGCSNYRVRVLASSTSISSEFIQNSLAACV